MMQNVLTSSEQSLNGVPVYANVPIFTESYTHVDSAVKA